MNILERYYIENGGPGHYAIFDRTRGSVADWSMAVACCDDAEMAERIARLLNADVVEKQGVRVP